MALTQKEIQEIQRKASLGLSLTNYTPEKQTIYDNARKVAQPPKPTYQAPKPFSYGDYSSKYQGNISDLMGQIQNTGPFEYDLESDKSYQSYKGQYAREGDRAMKNTMAEASALTGGRTNTWAMSAGQGAANVYNEKLNDRIPQLEQMAYQKYQNELAAKQNMVNMYSMLDQNDYSKYSNDKNMAYSQYESNRGFGYNQYRDQLGDQRTDDATYYQQNQDKLNQYHYTQEQATGTMRYNQEWKNQLAQQVQGQANIDRNFAAEEAQRRIANSLNERQFALSKAKSSNSSSKTPSNPLDKKMNFEDYLSYFKGLKSQMKESIDPSTSAKIKVPTISDEQLKQMIVMSGMPEEWIPSILNMTGLPDVEEQPKYGYSPMNGYVNMTPAPVSSGATKKPIDDDSFLDKLKGFFKKK